MTPLLSQNEVIQWINYYEEGGEIPDDIMVSLLFMAQRDAELTTVKEHAIKWQHEASNLEDENRAEFEESDCTEAMHAMEEFCRVARFLGYKIAELPDYRPGK